ncbi:hypothetical protein [Clostridium ihumii]|uniref:hypothetical protein n=1 Tax=Clostridium ihumii TaxID=1470356 RepID=UPI003D35593B
MFKNRRILRNGIICILLICTVHLVYSIVSDPLGEHDIIFALAVSEGFILIGSDKSGRKGKQHG